MAMAYRIGTAFGHRSELTRAEALGMADKYRHAISRWVVKTQDKWIMGHLENLIPVKDLARFRKAKNEKAGQVGMIHLFEQWGVTLRSRPMKLVPIGFISCGGMEIWQRGKMKAKRDFVFQLDSLKVKR